MRFPRFYALSLATLLFLPTLLHRPAVAQQTLPPIAPAPEDPKTAALRKQIQGYYDEMDRAIEQKDSKVGFKYIAPDCKIIMRDGQKMSLKALKETWDILNRRSIKTTQSSEITVFTQKGETATVEMRSTTLMRVRNDNGIENDLEAAGQGRDFWVKTKAGWRIKQTRETDRTLKLNGKIIEE